MSTVILFSLAAKTICGPAIIQRRRLPVALAHSQRTDGLERLGTGLEIPAIAGGGGYLVVVWIWNFPLEKCGAASHQQRVLSLIKSCRKWQGRHFQLSQSDERIPVVDVAGQLRQPTNGIIKGRMFSGRRPTVVFLLVYPISCFPS